MDQAATRPAFVFTEASDDPSVSRSTYENEDGVFFLSVHERPVSEEGGAAFVVHVFNMGDAGDIDGTVLITPWARLGCTFTPAWVGADPDVDPVESAEDAAMNWLDAEDVPRETTRALLFTEDDPEGAEHDWPFAG